VQRFPTTRELIAAGARLGKRRHIRQQWRSRRTADAERPNLACTYVRQRERQRRKHHIDLTRDNSERRRPAAFVRNMRHIDTGCALEHLAPKWCMPATPVDA
jgi:hypothetical protein